MPANKGRCQHGCISMFLQSLGTSVHLPWQQVLVPGKQNYSLAITWALDHDPVERVQQALAAAAGEEAAASTSGRLELDGAVTLERRKSLKMRRSASAQDPTEVVLRCTHATLISPLPDEH